MKYTLNQHTDSLFSVLLMLKTEIEVENFMGDLDNKFLQFCFSKTNFCYQIFQKL